MLDKTSLCRVWNKKAENEIKGCSFHVVPIAAELASPGGACVSDPPPAPLSPASPPRRAQELAKWHRARCRNEDQYQVWQGDRGRKGRCHWVEQGWCHRGGAAQDVAGGKGGSLSGAGRGGGRLFQVRNSACSDWPGELHSNWGSNLRHRPAVRSPARRG